MKNYKRVSEFTKHAKFEGVYVKHFFDSNDHDAINNMEVMIVPGYEIGLHTHDNSTEFIYCVEGAGVLTMEGEKTEFKKGDACFAKDGIVHSISNTGNEPIKLYAVFTPPIK